MSDKEWLTPKMKANIAMLNREQREMDQRAERIWTVVASPNTARVVLEKRGKLGDFSGLEKFMGDTVPAKKALDDKRLDQKAVEARTSSIKEELLRYIVLGFPIELSNFEGGENDLDELICVGRQFPKGQLEIVGHTGFIGELTKGVTAGQFLSELKQDEDYNKWKWQALSLGRNLVIFEGERKLTRESFVTSYADDESLKEIQKQLGEIGIRV